jgi:hypothetical protein
LILQYSRLERINFFNFHYLFLPCLIGKSIYILIQERILSIFFNFLFYLKRIFLFPLITDSYGYLRSRISIIYYNLLSVRDKIFNWFLLQHARTWSDPWKSVQISTFDIHSNKKNLFHGSFCNEESSSWFLSYATNSLCLYFLKNINVHNADTLHIISIVSIFILLSIGFNFVYK